MKTIPGDVIGAYADWLTSCVSMYGYVFILAQVKNAVRHIKLLLYWGGSSSTPMEKGDRDPHPKTVSCKYW